MVVLSWGLINCLKLDEFVTIGVESVDFQINQRQWCTHRVDNVETKSGTTDMKEQLKALLTLFQKLKARLKQIKTGMKAKQKEMKADEKELKTHMTTALEDRGKDDYNAARNAKE